MGEGMKLILDAVIVHCPACEHQYFRPPQLPLPAGSPLTCEQCGGSVYFAELLSQVDAAAA